MAMVRRHARVACSSGVRPDMRRTKPNGNLARRGSAATFHPMASSRAIPAGDSDAWVVNNEIIGQPRWRCGTI
eukprot:scaffold37869_cov48-Phaeocystis_antarctica.AAC.2